MNTSEIEREGFYERMWKDFVSLQRGDATLLCVNAARWAHFAGSPQTALMLGTKLDPNSEQDWIAECNRLADSAMTPNDLGNRPPREAVPKT